MGLGGFEKKYDLIELYDKELKAVKWVKEDFKDLEFCKRTPEEIIRAWMYRLDITEENLK